MAIDGYGAAGEFIDVFSQPAWQRLRAPFRAALAPTGTAAAAVPCSDPVVDLGAGTGLSTGVIAEACPGAPILAVEPSLVLRAVLLSRMAADPDLRARVTVLAADALGATLPERVGAVVAANMIGHLDREQRRELWRRVAARLAPDAPLVVNTQPPAEAVAIPDTTFARVLVGQHTYEGSGSAEPSGADSVVWRMRYRVLDEHGDTLDERRVNYPWYIVSPAGLLAELTSAGLTGELGDLGVIRAVRTRD